MVAVRVETVVLWGQALAMCLDVLGDILSPLVFSAVSSCGWCVAGEGDRWKEGQGESCLCFYHWCICSPLSSEGLTKGNNIGKIVFRSRKALETCGALCFFSGNNVVTALTRRSCVWLLCLHRSLFALALKPAGEREIRNDVMTVWPCIHMLI